MTGSAQLGLGCLRSRCAREVGSQDIPSRHEEGLPTRAGLARQAAVVVPNTHEELF